MPAAGLPPGSSASAPSSDEEICRRVAAGETALFEVLMRRHDQRVYRAVRALLRNEAEVEDVMQHAYVAAYAHLGEFSGEAKFSTWLVRIAINEALRRLRRASLFVGIERAASADEHARAAGPAEPDPEERLASREVARMLEAAVDELHENYRTVFMLREVEGMTTAETAEALSVSEDVVKTRLSRAKAMVRRQLYRLAGREAPEMFAFQAPRCDRVVTAVLSRIEAFPTQ
jgi:RNA polymerase sigma-70 factor (ECF subfamily)